MAINPKKKVVSLLFGLFALALALGGGWYYMNSTGYLGSSDTGASFLSNYCSEGGLKCPGGQVSSCLPVKCRCQTGGGKNVFVNAQANVCVKATDTCNITTTVVETPEMKELEELKKSLTEFNKKFEGKKLTVLDKNLQTSLNTSIQRAQLSLNEKSVVKTDPKCQKEATKTVANDQVACAQVCAQYNETVDTPDVRERVVEDVKAGVKVFYMYKGGNTWNYTVTGVLPTACHGVEISSPVTKSLPEKVSINLVLVEPASGKVCAAAQSAFSKKGSFSASKDASVSLSTHKFVTGSGSTNSKEESGFLTNTIKDANSDLILSYAYTDESTNTWSYGITGSLPSSCWSLGEPIIKVAKSKPAQVSVSVYRNFTAGKVCAQKLVAVDKKGTFVADKDSKITFGTLSGVESATKR